MSAQQHATPVGGESSSGDRRSEADAAAYARQKRYAWLLDIATTVAVPVGLIATDGSALLRDFANSASGVAALATLVYAAVLIGGMSLLSLPLDFFSGYVLEHRYRLSRQRPAGWLADWARALGLQLALGTAAVELIYSLARALPGTWWLVAAGSFVLFFVLLANLAPVLILPLFFRFEPLTDEKLRGRLLRLSERLGARVRGVYVWKLGEKSRKSNAALMGWGNTRRIVISDTMLESNTADEIEVVLAHELGHQVNRDIPRLMLLQAAITFAGFGILHLAVATWSAPLGYSGVADVANLPLMLLVALGASLLVLPATNAYSRRRERAADAFALRSTGNPDNFIAAMLKLGEQNLAQQQPHPVIEFLFHSHPSLARRIAFAREWGAVETAGDGLPEPR